jgi:hypothetical protein
MGQMGSIARRRTGTVSPTAATAQAFLRAKRAKHRSICLNHEEPRLGKASEIANAMAARQASITISEASFSTGAAISMFSRSRELVTQTTPQFVSKTPLAEEPVR